MSRPTPESVGATLLEFLTVSGALMATAVVEGATVCASDDGELTVERADAPEGFTEPLDPRGSEPLKVGMTVRRLPPMDVDAERGEVNGPLGGLEHLAEAVMALARALGAPGVALVQWPTLDEETTFAISARAGEGIVLVIGEEYYEMEPSWPGRPAPDPDDRGPGGLLGGML